MINLTTRDQIAARSTRQLKIMPCAAVMLATLTMPVYANAILTVGASGSYSTISNAVSYADSHAGTYYTIQIAPNTYVNDFPVVTVPLTLEASPATQGQVILRATIAPPNRKGIITTSANLTAIGMTFEGAAISDLYGANAAGIRAQAGTDLLTIRNSIFRNNQDGILIDSFPTAIVAISGSQFIGNGVATGPHAGLEHALYAGEVKSLSVSSSTFCGTLVGHDIKSRAASTTVTNNSLFDGASDPALACAAGSTSYAVDISNGGQTLMSGNTIVQGPSTKNYTMVSYGADGTLRGYSNSFSSSHDSFSNSLPGTSVGIYNHLSDVTAVVKCDSFSGVSNPTRGRAIISCTAPMPVPEPSSLSLMGAFLLTLAGFGLWDRRGRPSPEAENVMLRL